MNSSGCEMTFFEHLAELRKRILISVLAICVVSLLCFLWADELLGLLFLPFLDAFSGAQLIGTGPAEAFMAKLKVALLFGIALSSPLCFYQLWLFIVPALKANEKMGASYFVLSSSAFFLLGVCFCYFAVLPFAFHFFAGEFASIGVDAKIRVGEYLSFSTKLIAVFGLVFEMPVIVFFLSYTGVVDYRTLLSYSRFVVVFSFLVAAILTPPDLFTQLLLAVPLIGLYAVCVVVSYFLSRDRIGPTERTTVN